MEETKTIAGLPVIFLPSVEDHHYPISVQSRLSFTFEAKFENLWHDGYSRGISEELCTVSGSGLCSARGFPPGSAGSCLRGGIGTVGPSTTLRWSEAGRALSALGGRGETAA